MQILKDTAALAIVLLLAMTVRIESDRTPIDLDLATPVEAAALNTPESEARGQLDVAEVVRPGEAALASIEPGTPDAPFTIHEISGQGPGCSNEKPCRMLVIEQHLDSTLKSLLRLRRMSGIGSWKIETVPEAAPPSHCEASLDPGVSC